MGRHLFKPRVALMERIPHRLAKSHEEEFDKVVLLLPRFKGLVGKILLARLGKSQTVRFRLDEVGSFIWKNMDGLKNIEQLAQLHRARFGNSTKDSLERVALFVRSLERNGLIVLRGAIGGASSSGIGDC